MKYTNEQIRGAILRAADRIESNPRSYRFRDIMIPKNDCGTTACAWGWIGFEIGEREGNVEGLAMSFGLTAPPGYCGVSGHLYQFCKNMMTSADVPADLRAYADKYFPGEVVIQASAEHTPCTPQFMAQLSSWMRRESVCRPNSH